MKVINARENGFSLIEVLIALVVLAIGLLAIAQLQVAAVRGISLARHITAATQLAEHQIEYLRSVPYSDASPNVAPVDQNGNPIVDAQGKSIFLDDSGPLGDGSFSNYRIHSAHTSGGALNEKGEVNTGGQFPYYVRWRVERGGPYPGTPKPPGLDTVGIPGPGQMLIEVEVIWWEGDERPAVNTSLLQESWSSLMSKEAHRIVLQSMRQSNF